MAFESRQLIRFLVMLGGLFWVCLHSVSVAEENEQENSGQVASTAWQRKATEYARIMSRVTWTPVADGMPMRGGHFEKGREYTGVPYSSVKHVGRYIGFDIFLKTFLAAVENPESVLYTENLYGEVKNAECYYGKVCSSYTSYALQCGIWYVSRLHGPGYREGITLVEPQSAQAARVGDIIFTPPSRKGGGSHIEIVTHVTRDTAEGVTHVRVEESRPKTTLNTNRAAAAFDSHISARNRELYRITDLDAWRGENRAESFLFPNYSQDSATPVINRTLLLDRGDWVPYHVDQPVKFNVMDRDRQGVKSLVIKRGNTVVEEIHRPGRTIIERSYSVCGDYTAHCVMNDGSDSQACEFSVGDLDFNLASDEITSGKPWEIEFSSDNLIIIIVYFRSRTNSYGQHMVYVSAEERRTGKVAIPSDLLQDKGRTEVWLIGENNYGRLKKRKEFVVK